MLFNIIRILSQYKYISMTWRYFVFFLCFIRKVSQPILTPPAAETQTLGVLRHRAETEADSLVVHVAAEDGVELVILVQLETGADLSSDRAVGLENVHSGGHDGGQLTVLQATSDVQGGGAHSLTKLDTFK